MGVDCYFTHQVCAEEDFLGRTAVVIDVLRATSSIIAALAAGAKTVIPQTKVAEALALRQKMPDALLAGEREGELLAGFDLGNSPREFTPQAVAGRVIIACTTNGTAAIQKAQSADRLWLGALLNAQALAEKLASDCQNLAIVCSGTDGRPSLDDTVAAGAILYHLCQERQSLELNDAALMALTLYESYQGKDIRQALALCSHGRKLARFGRGPDIDFCAQENSSRLLPFFERQSGYIYA